MSWFARGMSWTRVFGGRSVVGEVGGRAGAAWRRTGDGRPLVGPRGLGQQTIVDLALLEPGAMTASTTTLRPSFQLEPTAIFEDATRANR